MSIAITDEHRELERVVAEFLAKHGALGHARALLEAPDEQLPPSWADLTGLGWLGLHVAEELGGSGFGLPELVVVVEGFGAAVAPGPFVPTVVASAALVAAEAGAVRDRLVPGLVDGSVRAGIGLDGAVAAAGGVASGSAVVLGGGLADVVLLASGPDLLVVDRHAAGVEVAVPANIDPSRRSARVTLRDAPVEVVTGGARALVDAARLLLAAEAAGVARACTEQAAAYAKVREQFGRPIGTFQAVKHHCADMLVEAELAAAAVWDAARAASVGGEELTAACAAAAALAVPAADLCAQLDIQVHGGIGFTWEHDAHLYARKALAIAAALDAERAAAEGAELFVRGVRRSRSVDLPPEAEPLRAATREALAQIARVEGDAERLRALVASGYAVPHWPEPWGRAAGALEQLVIEEELAAAGLQRPSYGITGWVILTLVQHADEHQIARWVRPALEREVIWCQLFSEPDAGSDAAGVKTRATRVDGGWLLNGQKVWTSGAHVARYGLATVRTDPEVPKHAGITTVVVDLQAPGVEVRPLRMPNGGTEFNEVFFDDVFVPDDDVVGPVDGGWTVARATLGNESVSLGGDGGGVIPVDLVVGPYQAAPERLAGGPGRLGRLVARAQAVDALNLRRVHRAVAEAGPGPEGAITKLASSENGHEIAAVLAQLAGPEGAFLDGPAAIGGTLALMRRALSIAGGTSEIKRNQIGERLLGLPRDPLIR